MIEVEHLTQRYGTYTAVQDVSFALSPGEVAGFLGPNGAGKTTTIKVLSSYLAPSAGQVRVGGFDVLSQPLEVRRVLGYLPERCPLYEEMVVRAFLQFVGRVRGLTRAERKPAIARAASLCRLEEVLDRPVSDLSKGYRQRVGIAQALLHDPPILILDEPTSGLDPNQVLEVRALVKELGAERTVLFSSHILSEVEATCARVVVLHQGRRVADGTVTELKQQITGGSLVVAFDPTPSVDLLLGLQGVGDVSAHTDGRFLVRPREGTTDLSARLFKFAVDTERSLVHLAPREITLEDVFASLTGAER